MMGATYTWDQFPDTGYLFNPTHRVLEDGRLSQSTMHSRLLKRGQAEFVREFDGRWYYLGKYSVAAEPLAVMNFSDVPQEVQKPLLYQTAGGKWGRREAMSLYVTKQILVAKYCMQRVGYNPDIHASLVSMIKGHQTRSSSSTNEESDTEFVDIWAPPW
ncbi:hypothetical protein AcV7_007701 [Taiwanofungus camphoratus]|nr:hypothetical protein AcV7_007701 [Antrodia cinnamomea]